MFSVINWFGVFFTRRLTTHHCFTLLLASADAILWVMHDSRLVCGSGPNEIIYKNDTDLPCYL